MSEHPNFHFFKGHDSIKDLVNKKTFYDYIKSLFVSQTDYKWKIKKYKDFVLGNGLDYHTCFKVLKDFESSFTQSEGKKYKGYISFLILIEKLNKTNNSQKLKLKDPSSKDALAVLFAWGKTYGDITNEALFTFASANIGTKYSRATIRFLFYEKNL